AVAGYELLAPIGEGGMGRVYLARRGDDGRPVAIKFLTPAAGADQHSRFQREVRLVARLTHPNVVTVLDHGTAQDRDYFVMEYVPGAGLRSLLTPGRPLALPRARSILAGIAEALAYLH